MTADERSSESISFRWTPLLITWNDKSRCSGLGHQTPSPSGGANMTGVFSGRNTTVLDNTTQAWECSFSMSFDDFVLNQWEPVRNVQLCNATTGETKVCSFGIYYRSLMLGDTRYNWLGDEQFHLYLEDGDPKSKIELFVSHGKLDHYNEETDEWERGYSITPIKL